MPSRLSHWTSACLPLDQGPNFESTDAISAYWRKVLEIFVAPRCDSFSLSGVHSVEQMERVACFSDWQPPVRDRVVIQFERDTRAAGRRGYEQELTRFQLGGESIGRLIQPQFHDWFVSSDNYPVDELSFFAGPHLLVQAEPNELVLLFCHLTPSHRESLWEIDPDAARAFDASGNWVAQLLRVTEPTKRP